VRVAQKKAAKPRTILKLVGILCQAVGKFREHLNFLLVKMYVGL
jgi:hypothetical protein